MPDATVEDVELPGELEEHQRPIGGRFESGEPSALDALSLAPSALFRGHVLALAAEYGIGLSSSRLCPAATSVSQSAAGYFGRRWSVGSERRLTSAVRSSPS